MVNNNVLEIVKIILQYSGVSGVVLIFWHLDSVRQAKQFNIMWADHQALTRCVVEAVNNNTRALENLKGYIKTAIKPAIQPKHRKDQAFVGGSANLAGESNE